MQIAEDPFENYRQSKAYQTKFELIPNSVCATRERC